MKFRVLVLTLLCFGPVGCSTVDRKSAPSLGARAHDSAALRVGTYNVYVGNRDSGKTAAVIQRMDADVIALQEVLPGAAPGLSRCLSQKYKYRHFDGGLGIASRFPLRNLRFHSSRRGINGFLFGEIELPGGRVQIANLHLDPLHTWTLGDRLLLPVQLWRQRAIHRDEVEQVFENLRPELPTILLGDFNRVSDTAIDRLRELGFTDSFATVTPRADRIPTIRFSIVGFPVGRRIDFIFHDNAFRTTGSALFSGRPSDHEALVSTLHRNGGKK